MDIKELAFIKYLKYYILMYNLSISDYMPKDSNNINLTTENNNSDVVKSSEKKPVTPESDVVKSSEKKPATSNLYSDSMPPKIETFRHDTL